MQKGRIEAFSDGVFAIIITIMVLELKVPHGDQLSDLNSMLPIFLSYVISFIYVGIYWNNHHHLFQAVKQVRGPTLWGNLHLLFWLSLLPFVTAWAGENHFSEWPMIAYGIVLSMCGIAFTILSRLLIRDQGADSMLKRAIGRDSKALVSVVGYVTAIGFAHISTAISAVIYVAVALLWLKPDTRIEKRIE